MALQELERLSTEGREVADADLIELYYERGWTDGLPVVPPTPDKVAACVAALGGDPDFVEYEDRAALGSADPRDAGHQHGDGRLQAGLRADRARRHAGVDRPRV